MNETVLQFGFLLVFIGIVVIIFGALPKKEELESGNTKVAVVGFLGPIPFGFSNDKNLLQIVLILSTAVILFFILNAKRLS